VTVLVTGGTGFIGSHTAAQLVRAGRPVRLLVRDRTKVARTPALREVDVETAAGDITDPTAVDEALDGCTGVVHAAAHVSLAAREAERAMTVNEGGTRTVLAAAAAAGIPAVTVSSVSVFDLHGPKLTPDTRLVDGGGPYTRSKVAGERVAREFQAGDIPVAIVYPSGVLGPDSPDVSVNHQALIGWVRTPPRTTSGVSLVDVRDVATAIDRALGRTGRFMLGGAFLTWAELHDAITDVTGHRRAAVPMPPRVLRAVGRLGDLAKRVVDFEYPLTLEALTMATCAVPCDSADAERELSLAWRPTAETLADSIRWLVAEGHLPAKLAGRLAS
jgi:nucleoside-diphosphate-sugar epimerase